MIRDGTPPSPPEALRGILMDTLASNGALRDYAPFLRAVEAVQAELGLDALEPRLAAFVQEADAMPSRARQAEIARAWPAGNDPRAHARGGASAREPCG